MSDFADIADTSTIRQSLSVGCNQEHCAVFLKGVYEKPKNSKLLDEYVAADPEAVAKRIGTKLSLDDCPMWKTPALNLLGSFNTGNSSVVLYQRWSI